MTTDPRERLRQIDPAPVDAEPPSGAIEAVAVIHEIERRMGMEPRETTDQPTVTSSQQQQEAAPPPSAPDQGLNAPGQRTSPGRRRSLLVGVAAFVAVLFVGVAAWGIVAVLGEDDTPVAGTSDDPAATIEDDTPVAGTSDDPAVTIEDDTPVARTSDDSAATIEDYRIAYNAGDLNGVMALFSEESVVIGSPLDPHANGESRGLLQIRNLHGADMREAASENPYTISNVEVTGNTVSWDHVWVNNGGENWCAEGHRAEIEDGKILSWTFATNPHLCP